MINAETVVNHLYTTYCAAVGGRAFNGDLLPDWEAFRADPSKKLQSDAWVRIAERAIELITP